MGDALSGAIAIQLFVKSGKLSTLAGPYGGDLCTATHKGLRRVSGTSVTASRMTDAYGASTLRVPHGRAPYVYDYPNAQVRHH